MWWMYQHTVVSAALACGVHVPIRSHVQALCVPSNFLHFFVDVKQ
ncbi:BZ3500_MvSof-1268-A1-R1_Chr1-2g01488 [Microbotryum saponariae]|uniref:BZ3500_MvSof-1268-A1-R1_Chr1-2g01488 protein n=1 Tax=Microbotryum saponariae TaxID=289078 RepID=A0A2X0KIS5_9BASI|nr:BZ3500_MvSof-1268-A1-R1_Chr1-2g01488 [Microbotryum saponariae]SCZ97496.1 BZ3501_MvSof-1269-A2-R1_Chr1-2g01087 [Microbotryum saponariae]